MKCAELENRGYKAQRGGRAARGVSSSVGRRWWVTLGRKREAL